MLPIVALFTAAALGAADLHAANTALGSLPALSPHSVVLGQGPALPIDHLTLRSPLLEAQARTLVDDAERSAQHHRRHHGTSGGSSSGASTSSGAADSGESAGASSGSDSSGGSDSGQAAAGSSGAAAPSGGAGGAASTTGGSTDASSSGSSGGTSGASSTASSDTSSSSGDSSGGGGGDEEPDIELIRHREHQARTHRVLGFTTLGSLVVTEVLGTLLAANEGTLFSHPCGCISFDPLVPLHLTSAFITVSLYATTGIFALTMPDPEHAAAGHDSRGEHLRWHQRMAWIHFSGMVLMPILGIATSMPALFGVSGPGLGDFITTMRTIHLGVGYITLAALTTAMAFEL